MTNRNAAFAAIAFFVFGSALAPAEAPSRIPLPKTVTVTGSDTGKKIKLLAGDRLVVRLAANPTTGFSWKASNSNSGALRMAGAPKYEGPKNNRIGAGGTEVYTFVAAKTGSVELTFTYQRSWENKAASKTVKFTVQVQARPKR